MDIPTGNRAYTNVNGIQRPVIPTNGLYVRVKWRDLSNNWVPLHLIKESNLINMAEHVMANIYFNEPDFIWWVRKVLKKRDRLMKKVKSRCQKK